MPVTTCIFRVCVCVCRYIRHSAHMKGRANFWVPVLIFHHVWKQCLLPSSVNTLSPLAEKKKTHFGESNLCNHLSSLSKDFSSRVRRISGTTVSTACLRVIGRLVRHSLDYFPSSSFSLSTHVDLLQVKCMPAGSPPWRRHMAEHWSSPLMKDLQHTHI